MSNIHERVVAWKALDKRESLALETLQNTPDSEVARAGCSEIVSAIYELAKQVAALNSLLASSSGPSHEPPSPTGSDYPESAG